MTRAIIWVLGVVTVCCTILYLCGVPLWDIARIVLFGIIGMVIGCGILVLPAMFDDFDRDA